MKPVFDYSDGDYCYEISDNMLMDSDGNLMQDMGGGMAMDMNSGEDAIFGVTSINPRFVLAQKIKR